MAGVVGVVALADEGDELREVQVFVEAPTDVRRTREEVTARASRYGITGVAHLYVFAVSGASLAGTAGTDQPGPATAEELPARLVIERVTAGWVSERRVAQVVLATGDREAVGEATADRDTVTLTAEATLRAIDELVGADRPSELIAITQHTLESRPTVSVLVRADDDVYVGSCLSTRHLAHECAVRATLHALNRRIAARLSESP